MPKQRDLIWIMAELLSKEAVAAETEVLDELVGITESLPLSDVVTVTETTSFIGIVGTGTVGFCEVG